MTAPYERSSVDIMLANLLDRVRKLEAVPPIEVELHGAEMSMSADWTNPTNGNNTIAFDTVQFDTDGYCDTSGHRFTVPVGLAGFYAVTLRYQYSSVGTGPTISLWYGGAHGSEPIIFDILVAGAIEASTAALVYLEEGWSVYPNSGKSAGTQIVDGTAPFLVARFGLALQTAPYTP